MKQQYLESILKASAEGDDRQKLLTIYLLSEIVLGDFRAASLEDYAKLTDLHEAEVVSFAEQAFGVRVIYCSKQKIGALVPVEQVG